MRPPEPRGQPGNIFVDFGKPALKFDTSKAGSYDQGSKQFMSSAISNICHDDLKKTSDPNVFWVPTRGVEMSWTIVLDQRG